MLANLIKIAVPFVWFGMVAAISFIEAPIKFRAPGITLPLGLGIGRLVFQALNIAEIVLAVILGIAFIFGKGHRGTALYLFSVVLVILALQTFWLLPSLDLRAELVIAGETPPFSKIHILYIGVEIIKIIMLFACGVVSIRAIAKGG